MTRDHLLPLLEPVALDNRFMPTWSIFGPLDGSHLSSATFRDDRVAKFKEQAVGNGAIIRVGSASDDADVGTGPSEAVHFTKNDPARLIVEAKIALDRSEQFDRLLCWQRLAVRYGNNIESHPAIFYFSGDDDRNRTVFQAFFLPSFFFVRPQIRIGKDVTWFRNRPSGDRRLVTARRVQRHGWLRGFLHRDLPSK